MSIINDDNIFKCSLTNTKFSSEILLDKKTGEITFTRKFNDSIEKDCFNNDGNIKTCETSSNLGSHIYRYKDGKIIKKEDFNEEKRPIYSKYYDGEKNKYPPGIAIADYISLKTNGKVFCFSIFKNNEHKFDFSANIDNKEYSIIDYTDENFIKKKVYNENEKLVKQTSKEKTTDNEIEIHYLNKDVQIINKKENQCLTNSYILFEKKVSNLNVNKLSDKILNLLIENKVFKKEDIEKIKTKEAMQER